MKAGKKIYFNSVNTTNVSVYQPLKMFGCVLSTEDLKEIYHMGAVRVTS